MQEWIVSLHSATHLIFCLQVLYGDLQIFVALDGCLSGALQGHKLVFQATVYCGRGQSALTTIHRHLYIPVEESFNLIFLVQSSAVILWFNII